MTLVAKSVCATLSVRYSDRAYWQDVFGGPYAGTTEPYTIVNAGFGVKWMSDRFTTSIKATNLGNDNVHQHAFGDITNARRASEGWEIAQKSEGRRQRAEEQAKAKG